jgi:acyl-CoA thioesterase
VNSISPVPRCSDTVKTFTNKFRNISQDIMDITKARNFFAQDRYAALAGVEIIEAGTGYCKAKLKIEDRHLNAANVVQGGAIFTLADLAFAVASNSHGQLALAINVNISFLQGKSTGTLYATATEVSEPKRLGAYDVLITDEQDQIIARFNGMVYRKNQLLPGF